MPFLSLLIFSNTSPAKTFFKCLYSRSSVLSSISVSIFIFDLNSFAIKTMTPYYQIGCIAATLLSLTSAAVIGQAAQVPKAAGRSLIRRLETNFAGCSADQKSKLEVDFSDAAALGNIGYNMDRTSTA